MTGVTKSIKTATKQAKLQQHMRSMNYWNKQLLIQEQQQTSIRELSFDNDEMDQLLTEVCYLLEVSWEMCHAWITHWTVARAILTMSRRRSTHDERTHGRDAREPLLARTRARLAPRALIFES